MNTKAKPQDPRRDAEKHAKATASQPAVADDQMLMRWNSELVSLYSKRMQEYWALPLQMMTCASPDDVADVQERFMRKLREDYGAAAAGLAELATRGLSVEPQENYAATLLKAQEDARAIIDQARAQAARIMAEAEERSQPQPQNDEGAAAA